MLSREDVAQVVNSGAAADSSHKGAANPGAPANDDTQQKADLSNVTVTCCDKGIKFTLAEHNLQKTVDHSLVLPFDDGWVRISVGEYHVVSLPPRADWPQLDAVRKSLPVTDEYWLSTAPMEVCPRAD